MSVRRLAPKELQPGSFAFSPENAIWAGKEIAKYPEGRQQSAVIPLLWRAQEQNGGWVSEAAIRHVSELLAMPQIRVMEIATFYTMFALEPVGTHFVQLCGTTPCALRGAEALKQVCREIIGPEKTVSADGKLSWLEVECLGACSNAPMVQVNYDYYEDLTPESLTQLLGDLCAGKDVKTGPQNTRRASEPEGGPRVLTDPSLYDGSVVGAWKARFAAEDAKRAEEKRAEEEKAKATETAAAKGDDKSVAAEAAATPEPAKPSGGTRAEQANADTPAHRAARGAEPVKPADHAAAADEAKSTTVTGGKTKTATATAAAPGEPAPSATKPADAEPAKKTPRPRATKPKAEKE